MVGHAILPGHAYIPGENERHPEGAFDPIRRTAQLGMSTEDLARSDAFQIGLQYIDAEFYWEAHEVLEPVWMALSEDSDERRFVQGLIQMANGFLKIRMNRPKAALRLAHIARDLVNSDDAEFVLGLRRAEVVQKIEKLEQISNMQYNA